MGATTQAVIAAGMGVGFSASMSSSSSSPQAVYALINQFQMFFLFSFLNTYKPADLEAYLTELEIFSLDFSFMEDIEIPWFETKIFELNYDQEDINFSNNGLDSGSFVISHFNLFKMLFVYLLINLSFIALYLILKR